MEDKKKSLSKETSSAIQFSDVIKGYNPDKSIQLRNQAPVKEGYNPQQSIQDRNDSQQTAPSNTTSKNKDEKKK